MHGFHPTVHFPASLPPCSLDNPHTMIHIDIEYVNSYTFHLSQFMAHFTHFSSVNMTTAKSDLSSKVLWKAALDSYPHTRYNKHVWPPGNCSMHDKECKIMPDYLYFVLIHDPPSMLFALCIMNIGIFFDLENEAFLLQGAVNFSWPAIFPLKHLACPLP